MRCYICDSEIEHPQRDARDGTYLPCLTCQEAIDDALGDFEEFDEDLNDDEGRLY